MNEPGSSSVSASSEPIISSLANKPRFLSSIRKFTPRLFEQLDVMDQAAREHNFGELNELAHWLKGAGGTLGYNVFTEPATLLGTAAKTTAIDDINTILKEIRQLAERIVVPEDTSANSVAGLAHETSFSPARVDSNQF